MATPTLALKLKVDRCSFHFFSIFSCLAVFTEVHCLWFHGANVAKSCEKLQSRVKMVQIGTNSQVSVPRIN